MTWEDLRTDITEMFSDLTFGVDLETLWMFSNVPLGMRRDSLSLVRATTKERMSEEERRSRRRSLEQRRRTYKTSKAREYYARSVGGKVRPYTKKSAYWATKRAA